MFAGSLGNAILLFSFFTSVAGVCEVCAASFFKVKVSEVSFHAYIGFGLICPQQEGWGADAQREPVVREM
jgi:hypothetical protein